MRVQAAACNEQESTNWLWEFTSGWTSFEAKSPRYIRGSTLVGTQKILVNDLLSNSGILGDSDGEVRVSAMSAEGTERSVALSTEVNIVNPEAWRAKVYFLKDEEYFGHPNWYQYWKQTPLIIQEVDKVYGIKLFDIATCRFEDAPTKVNYEIKYAFGSTFDPSAPSGTVVTYGQNFFNARTSTSPYSISGDDHRCRDNFDDGMEHQVGSFYNEYTYVEIHKGCGFTKQIYAGEGETLRGIHTFYSTLVHEVEHAIISCAVWNGYGYDSVLDTDLDAYRDEWEEQSHEIDGMAFEFEKDRNDRGGVGTEYEEARCRKKEANLNLDIINPYDWSFDPSGIAQGKQW